ncbi:MAG: hypothetical protein U0793_10105 [Gemmataceae bacterium]
MPHFTVAYRPTALDELAQIWLVAPDAQAVADASNYIDRLLRVSPDAVGVDFGSFRTLGIEPLEVDFIVKVDDRYVEVLNVRFVG